MAKDKVIDELRNILGEQDKEVLIKYMYDYFDSSELETFVEFVKEENGIEYEIEDDTEDNTE
jgi:hypothetical protein